MKRIDLMPKIVRSTDPTQGHCWPPALGVPVPQASKFYFGSGVVTVDGVYPVLVNDVYNIHPGVCPEGSLIGIPPHEPAICLVGSKNTFIYDIPIVRDADPLSCGDVADAGDTLVFVEGGGYGGPEAVVPPGTPENLVLSYEQESTGFSIFPAVVEYPPLIIPYRLNTVGLNDDNQYFAGGCPVSYTPEVYSPMQEGGTGAIFNNYPDSGAQLPSYAPPFYSNPIPITDYRLIVNGQPSINGQIFPGLYFDFRTGTISGSIISDPRSSRAGQNGNVIYTGEVKIQIGVAAKNPTGFSSYQPFEILFSRGSSC